MTDRYIEYRSGYKYQLAADFGITTSIKPNKDIETPFITLFKNGFLVIRKGYAWDGTSGPVIDTHENLRASLVHDALYQLMRRRKISFKKHRDKADRLFMKMCKQDGLSSLRARIYYEVLKRCGLSSASPENIRRIEYAPNKS
jgi:hypothetical protein